MNSEPIKGSEENFFRRLAEMTVAYESQPFLPFGGKIVSCVRGREFKLWPQYCTMFTPVLVGSVAEGVVAWRVRWILLTYVWWPVMVAFFVCFAAMGVGFVAAAIVFVVLILLSLLAIRWGSYSIVGRSHEEEMERIVRCAARGTG